MEDLTNAIRRAVDDANWFAALALALTIPDICGHLETPEVGSKVRSVRWFDEYMAPTYTLPLPQEPRMILIDGVEMPELPLKYVPHVFLSGTDFYALRCALLHQGSDNITDQRARDALTAFQFCAPDPRSAVHMNQLGTRLQLQIDIICEQICQAVTLWLAEVQTQQPEVASRMEQQLIRIGPTVAPA